MNGHPRDRGAETPPYGTPAVPKRAEPGAVAAAFRERNDLPEGGAGPMVRIVSRQATTQSPCPRSHPRPGFIMSGHRSSGLMLASGTARVRLPNSGKQP